jgi:hypothetical protein
MATADTETVDRFEELERVVWGFMLTIYCCCRPRNGQCLGAISIDAKKAGAKWRFPGAKWSQAKVKR